MSTVTMVLVTFILGMGPAHSVEQINFAAGMDPPACQEALNWMQDAENQATLQGVGQESFSVCVTMPADAALALPKMYFPKDGLAADAAPGLPPVFSPQSGFAPAP